MGLSFEAIDSIRPENNEQPLVELPNFLSKSIWNQHIFCHGCPVSLSSSLAMIWFDISLLMGPRLLNRKRCASHKQKREKQCPPFPKTTDVYPTPSWLTKGILFPHTHILTVVVDFASWMIIPFNANLKKKSPCWCYMYTADRAFRISSANTPTDPLCVCYSLFRPFDPANAFCLYIYLDSTPFNQYTVQRMNGHNVCVCLFNFLIRSVTPPVVMSAIRRATSKLLHVHLVQKLHTILSVRGVDFHHLFNKQNWTMKWKTCLFLTRLSMFNRGIFIQNITSLTGANVMTTSIQLRVDIERDL